MRRSRGSIRGAAGRSRNVEPTDVGKALTNKHLQSSWGETRTPDPGIMRAGSSPLTQYLSLSRSSTDTHGGSPNATLGGTVRGTVDNPAKNGGEVCGQVPDRVPSCMGADRQRAAWCAFLGNDARLSDWPTPLTTACTYSQISARRLLSPLLRRCAANRRSASELLFVVSSVLLDGCREQPKTYKSPMSGKK